MKESIKQLSDNIDKLCAMIKCTCDKIDELNKSLEHIDKQKDKERNEYK